jgi:dipeptidyl aminopeptidase/acylaminoacyl peptidase
MDLMKRLVVGGCRAAACALFCSLSLSLPAAHAQQRPLTAADFNTWRDISGPTLSHDGQFLAYGLFPQEGDGEIIVRDLKANRDVLHIPAGQLPPPPADDPNAEGPPPPRAIRLSFSQDGKTLAFLAYANKVAVEAAKKDKNGPAHEELVVVDLATLKASRFPGVKSFQLPEKGDGYLAYLKYAPPAAKSATPAAESTSDADAEETIEDQRAGARAGAVTSNAQFGSELVLLKLADATPRSFPDVLEYTFAKDAKTLALSVASPKPENDGVFVVDPSGTEVKPLIAEKGRFQHLTWNDQLSALAFIGNPSADPDARKPPYQLFLWKTTEARAAAVVTGTSAGFHPGYVIADHAALTFSKDGSRLFFGAAPPPPPPHASSIDEDKPSFDLWRTADDYIQPVQKVRAPADLNRSFRAVYLIPHHRMIQLADEAMTELTPNEEGRYALGTDDHKYRPLLDYGNRTADYYLVDLETGTRTPVLMKHEGVLRWSGDGRYLLAFDGKNWTSIAVPSLKSVNLTEKLPVKFWNEDNDVPAAPGPYGVAGWTKDDKYVLLYDHFDVWQVAPDGSSATSVTDGFGRARHIEFRYSKLDAEEKTIDPAKPLLLRAEDSVTHDSGFYATRLGATQPPTKLLMAPKDFSAPIKAKDADVLVTTGQTFTEFPDLLVTDASFKTLTKVSEANPQQKQFLWGSDELISYQSLDGIPLQGILYKPANFDPNHKYPMITYFYEKLSNTVNHFVDPKPMDSINIAYYVSNGYMVFVPDIVYTTGYPGQSALKCVLAGVNKVASMGSLDEKNIGLQGHSWGGYQIAYIVTQTNRFKAAEDGAPVVNMISAYDGIRWGSGRPRQFQYEQTQSRIGGTPWDHPLRFIENSPIFMVDRVQTPLLILHNDADDAVPWYQGIEFFLALRRLGKQAWMLSYNGEPHHLRRRPNQKDYAARMAQFFDYELKGGKMPAWMEQGIPYLHTAEQMKVDDRSTQP